MAVRQGSYQPRHNGGIRMLGTLLSSILTALTTFVGGLL
jgi:hypothetical protein